MRIRGWLVLVPVWTGACLGELPELDYDTETGTETMAPSTTMDAASAATLTTTGPSSSATMTTMPPDTDTSSDTSSSSSSDTTTSTETGEPPEDFGPCSPVADGLVVAHPGSDYTVANDEIAIELEAASNGVVTSLVDPEAAGAELLHTAAEPVERITGIGYFVLPLENEYSWRGTDPTITVLEEGPAVVRLRVAWTTNDASTVAALAGTTEYTVIPDGRLVRHEQFELTHEDTPASNVWITMYAALASAQFTNVRGNFNAFCPKEFMVSPNECEVGHAPKGVGTYILGYGVDGADTWMCGYDNTTGRSVTWITDAAAESGTNVTARTTEYHTALGEHTFALQYDWLVDSTPVAGMYEMTAMLYLNVEDDDKADACDCAEEMFDAYSEPPTFETDGVSTAPYVIEGGYFDVGVPGAMASLTLTGGNPPTLLLRLDGPSAVNSVMLDGDTLDEGVDYLTQEGMGGASAWLYLARPLAVGQELVIDTK